MIPADPCCPPAPQPLQTPASSSHFDLASRISKIFLATIAFAVAPTITLTGALAGAVYANFYEPERGQRATLIQQLTLTRFTPEAQLAISTLTMAEHMVHHTHNFALQFISNLHISALLIGFCIGAELLRPMEDEIPALGPQLAHLDQLD